MRSSHLLETVKTLRIRIFELSIPGTKLKIQWTPTARESNIACHPSLLTGCHTTIEFWYSIPTVFKTGQLQSEYSPGIITVGIQSETFFVVGIQSHCVRVWGFGYEISLFLCPYEILVTSTNYYSRNTVVVQVDMSILLYPNDHVSGVFEICDVIIISLVAFSCSLGAATAGSCVMQHPNIIQRFDDTTTSSNIT